MTINWTNRTGRTSKKDLTTETLKTPNNTEKTMNLITSEFGASLFSVFFLAAVGQSVSCALHFLNTRLTNPLFFSVLFGISMVIPILDGVTQAVASVIYMNGLFIF